jgi:hypothetical protein
MPVAAKKTKAAPAKKTKAAPVKKEAAATEGKAEPAVTKPKFTKVVDCRPKGVEETGLAFTGYEISEDGTRINQKLHYDQLYTIRNGANSRHFLGFLEGKIQETEWVELKPQGVVHTFTIAGWSGRSSLKRLPFVLAYGIIDGCKTAVANEVHGLDPWDAEFNMPLKVVFKPKAERVGAMVDWHFEPGDGWKPGPMTPEKERMKKLTLPVYDWVKTL